MIGRKLSWVLLALMMSACSRTESLSPDTSDVVDLSDREYSVLAAILDSVYRRPPDSIVVLRDSTDSGVHGRNLDSVLTVVLQYATQYLLGLTQETRLDFKAKNLTRTFVGRPSRIHPGCVRSSSTARLYPSMSVGRVGFDVNGTQALAYVGYLEAPLGGAGDLYLLAREGQSWRIVGSMMLWIS
jgi:hypothetical protein